MSDNTNEAAQRFRGQLPAALLIAAIAFSACGKAEGPASQGLPSVTDYISEASIIRDSETENDAETTVESTIFSSDRETVSAGDAASRQTESDSSRESEPSETIVPEETSAVQSSETTTISEGTSVSSVIETTESAPETSASTKTAETLQLETECSVPAASSPVADTNYDSEFFESDLFIGDSISTGYSLYGFLSEKNVYAKVGLNPSTVLTKNVSTCYGEIGVSEMLAYTMPRRVYIMLGSNGIQWLSVGNMLQSTNTLVWLIKETCPDCDVVIISVPPVTAEYDSTVEDVNVIGKINEYNSSLNAYCTANKLLFVNAASILKDETGYFNSAYAESDGMHFKSSAYKTLLSKIQSDVTEFEELNAPKETEAETEFQTETSAEETDETSPETFVTLPEKTEKTDE